MALAAAQQPSPVVVFKKSRTGSTWLADMLAQDARVAFFRHEAQGCFTDDAERTRKALEVMVRRPTCSTQMCPNAKKGDAWLTAPTTTDCFDNKLVGFDLNPSHTPFLSWERDWPQLLRTPVKTVVYMRTNLIKHAVSSIHADVLVKACDTHKVLSQKAKDCVESNTEALSQRIAVDALSLSKSARKLGQYWVSLLNNTTTASGGKVFVLYYEALQRDASVELGRLFDYVGVSGSSVPESSSVKITPDDLRETLADFEQVQKDLSRIDPALLPQLEDTSFRVFRNLKLPDNKTQSITPYEVQRPKSNFIVITTQRSGSGWLLTELQKSSCIECGRELFDRDGFLWGTGTVRAAVDGFLRMTPGGSNAFNMTVGDKFNYEAKKWRAERSDKARSYGFKWMTNQPSSELFYEAFEAWLLPLLREHRGKLVFLVRQHLLRQMVSREANKIDSERFEKHVAHPHSTEVAQEHAAPVELPVGHQLLRHLDLELSKVAHLEKLAKMASDAGVRVRTVSYEDLDADKSQFDSLRSWLVDGDPCASAFVERPETIFKIHGDAHWQKYISNWNNVSKSLQGTRYAVYLDEAYVPRGGDAWEKLRDAPVSPPKKKVHDTHQPHNKTERPGRLYPRDVPGCVTAGKDHHCRMKTYGNRTAPPVVAPPPRPRALRKKESWLGSWLRWPRWLPFR
jgi:LPS sulfotransferase NodH